MARMLIGGEAVESDEVAEVRSPFDGSVVDVVPVAAQAHVEKALAAAEAAARSMRKTTGYDRFLWLRKAAQMLESRAEEFATLLSREEGKTLAEARFEASRAIQTLEWSAEEAKRIVGEQVPLDGAPGGGGKLGFTIRVPCGVVAAVTPFNFPLNLVAHKLGPAIAAGNAVVLKPATDTPLVGIKLCELLIESGVPAEAVQVLTGAG